MQVMCPFNETDKQNHISLQVSFSGPLVAARGIFDANVTSISLTPGKGCGGCYLSGWSQSPHVVVPTVCHLGGKRLQGNRELALSQNQLQSTVSSVSDMLCWVLLS